MTDQRRVEIHDGWFGLLIEEGPAQSLVRVTKCDEPLLVGKTICFMNHELTKIPQTEEERLEMTTVMELTKKYNDIAVTHGLPPIKKFKDKATAEKRLEAIGGKAIAALEKKSDAAAPQSSDGGGTQGKDEIVKALKFKKAKGGNLRRDLFERLWSHKNEMVAKKSLGNLAQAIAGLAWAISERRLTGKLEIKEEKKDGQVYCGLFEK